MILGRIKDSGLLLYEGAPPEEIPADVRILAFSHKSEDRGAGSVQG